MRYQLVDDIWQETQEALDRIVEYWRSQVVSVGLSPDEHLLPKVIMEISPTAHLFSGEIWVSEEALAKIKQYIQHRRLELIEAQLEVGLAFARLAQHEYSLEEFARAEQAITNARRTQRVIVKSLPNVQPGEKERQRIEGKLKELEQALEQLPKLRKVR